MPKAEFIPPKRHPAVIALFRAVLPRVLKTLGIVDVVYIPEELEGFRERAPHRILLTPNHPTNTEPALLFHLSATVDQSFYYLACRESFDPFFGLWGAVTQRLGAYSVIRGTLDRASFRATRELLAQPASKVVIFPEGEVYSQNDSLLPFHEGAFQLAFWALEDVRKTGDIAPLYIQPVAIKYRFVRAMDAEIRASLARLERFTGASTSPAEAPYTRLRAIAQAMLASLEQEYRLPAPRHAEVDDDMTPRLNAVKEAILERVAAAAGVPSPRGETLPERMRALIHAIETVTHEDPVGTTPYDTELRRQQRTRAFPLLYDLRRLANWIAVYDGYVRAHPSPERMADTLVRLERECFGKARLDGPRRCFVRLPPALNLAERYPAYERSKRAAVTQVAHEVEAAITACLTEN